MILLVGTVATAASLDRIMQMDGNVETTAVNGIPESTGKSEGWAQVETVGSGGQVKVHADVTSKILARRDTTTNSTAKVSSPISNSTAPNSKPSHRPKECRNKRGTKIGQIIVTQPNISSIAIVGKELVISWYYTSLVKRLPRTVDIKINSADGLQSWNERIVQNLDVSNGGRAWVWKVGSYITGPFRIRIVPDGKETAGKRSDEQPCFLDGDPMPGTSAAFKISHIVELEIGKDRYPPNTSSSTPSSSLGFTALAVLLMLFVVPSLQSQ
ncbi:hypothetical protein HDU97_001705 [Phlyctochytrium planicorne]|nr:hypothetical protein HDU97_001705 [Phlyctochytrium planicorne]